jgi:hypothetical protein
VAPFELGPQSDTAGASAALVDIKGKLDEWKDVGFDAEMTRSGRCSTARCRTPRPFSGPYLGMTPDWQRPLAQRPRRASRPEMQFRTKGR